MILKGKKFKFSFNQIPISLEVHVRLPVETNSSGKDRTDTPLLHLESTLRGV